MSEAQQTPPPCHEHPDRPAQWFCPACRISLCETCVRLFPSAQSTVATCRQCGQLCSAVSQAAQQQATVSRDAEPREDEDPPYPRRLIQAWRYPLRGQGWALLLVGGGILWILGLLSWIPLVSLLLGIPALAYLSSYMISVLTDSAAGHRTLPHWPDLRDWWDDLVRPALLLIGIGFVCQGPSIAWAVWQGSGAVATALSLLGAAYYPMALLAVALFDTIGALSPAVVIPSILRIPRDYLLACIGIAALYLLYPVNNAVVDAIPIVGGLAGSIAVLYLIVVEMHLIGTLYHANRYQLGWFERSPEPAGDAAEAAEGGSPAGASENQPPG